VTAYHVYSAGILLLLMVDGSFLVSLLDYPIEGDLRGPAHLEAASRHPCLVAVCRLITIGLLFLMLHSHDEV